MCARNPFPLIFIRKWRGWGYRHPERSRTDYGGGGGTSDANIGRPNRNWLLMNRGFGAPLNLNPAFERTRRPAPAPQPPQCPAQAADLLPASAPPTAPNRTRVSPRFLSSAVPASLSLGTPRAAQWLRCAANSLASAPIAALRTCPSKRNPPGHRTSELNPQSAASTAPSTHWPAPPPQPEQS